MIESVLSKIIGRARRGRDSGDRKDDAEDLGYRGRHEALPLVRHDAHELVTDGAELLAALLSAQADKDKR